MPLRFVARSAEALNERFRQLWPGHESSHICFVDAQARLDETRRCLSGVKNQLDLLVIYLGGHGRVAGAEFRFLFSGKDTAAAVDAAELDRLIALPRATSVLLFLDCCYAGAYALQSTFFPRHVGRITTRLCIASSGPGQRSWEDASLQRTLFADALDRALVSTTPATIRVASGLYHAVERDVARHAFALKDGAQQEPTLVGDKESAMNLPTGPRSHVRPTSLSTFAVLRRRTRQIALATSAVAFTAMVAVVAVTWRPAINQDGHVELRYGPKWLAAFNVGPLQRRVVTNVQEAEVAPSQWREWVHEEQGVWPWMRRGRAEIRP
jgi:hypothetical protein